MNIKTYIIFILILILASCKDKNFDATTYSISIDTVYHSSDTMFLQARTSKLNSEGTEALITQSIYGNHTHSYGDIYAMQMVDNKWRSPYLVDSLVRHITDVGLLRAIGDLTPEWHEKTKTVLCTGKSFFSYSLDEVTLVGNQREDIEHLQEIAYSIYYPTEDKWSGIKVLEVPEKLKNGDDFFCVNAGCTQRVDLPNGDVLLPVRYLKDKNYVSTVLLCTYDGKELRYVKHGTTFTVEPHRGLYEPSIGYYNGEFFLTMRGDESAFVAKSKNGLNYGELHEWKYDDGSVLGSYNTQQHWVMHKSGLYLVYTRKGANNDDVFRHRAPLFIAKVDTENLTILKETERVLIPIPEGNGDLGNFGVSHINDNEVWVAVSVMPQRGRDTNTLIAKINWN